MDKKLTWLHLSDIHIRTGDSYDRDIVITSLLADISSLADEQGVSPDCIFITGDLTFSGKSEEYNLAGEFISKVSNASGVPLSRIFCVPGNHDIDRSRITPLLRTFTDSLNSRDLVSELVGKPQELSLFTARFTPFRAAVTTNFDPFLENSRKQVEVILPDAMEKLGGPGVDTLRRDKTVFLVVKIHGSYNDVDSIVLTRGDFRRMLFQKPKYREFLVRLFTDATIFFYGYSFRDPNVDFVLQSIMSLYEGKTRPHYALMPDLGKIKRHYLLEDYNIRVIPYRIWKESHVAATTFLQQLANICR